MRTRPDLPTRLHETAKAIVLGLLNGSLLGTYPRERLLDLHDAVRLALGDARLPEPWDALLPAHRDALETGRVLDEAGVLQLLRDAGIETALLAETLYSPDAAPDRAAEYAELVWASQLRALASRLHNAAGAGDLAELSKLVDLELSLLLERRHAPAQQPALHPRTPAQILSAAPRETEWLWYGIIPAQGFTLLAGREKSGGGKSTLLFALLSALAHGKPFLGRQTNPRRILYLSEESSTTVAQKLERFGLDANDGILLLCRDDFPQGTLGALSRHLRDIQRIVQAQRVEYVIIDTLQGFSRITGDDENKSGAMLSEILAPIQRMLSWGVGVLLVHHMARHTGEARGSTALLGATDMNLAIRRLHRDNESSTERVLRWTGRYDEGEIVYRFKPDTAEYELLGDRYEAQQQETARAILQYLQTVDEPQTADAICQAVGGNRQGVYEALHALTSANALTRVGSGRRGDPYLYLFAEISSTLNPSERELISAKVDAVPCTPETVLTALQQSPNATSRQLAEQLGVSERRIRQILSELVEQGLLKREGSPRGGYHYRFAEISSRSEGLSAEPISAKSPASLNTPDACAAALEEWLTQHTGDELLQLDAEEAQQVREAFQWAQTLDFPALEVMFPDGSPRVVAPNPSAWLQTLQQLALYPSQLDALRSTLQNRLRNGHDLHASRPRETATRQTSLFADGTPPA